jgi:hypothetical protein
MNRRSYDGALLDVASASVLLGCSEKTLRARASRRLVPFVRFSGRVLFRRGELEKFLETLDGCTTEEAIANISARQGEAVRR